MTDSDNEEEELLNPSKKSPKPGKDRRRPRRSGPKPIIPDDYSGTVSVKSDDEVP